MLDKKGLKGIQTQLDETFYRHFVNPKSSRMIPVLCLGTEGKLNCPPMSWTNCSLQVNNARDIFVKY